MSGPSTYVPKSAIGRWFESRLPMMGLVHFSFVAYPTPRNLNYMWAFGAILSFMLVAQIVTGVVLAMHYVPSATEAFGSINHIMRDVNYGWLVRYMHTNGATLFFLACYIHMFRGIYYGSFKAPPRTSLDHRSGDLLPDGRDGLSRLRPALGLHELRRRDGYHQPPLGYSLGWHRDNTLALGRLRGRRSDAQPLFLAALSASLRHRRRRGPARLGASRGGAEQSGRRRG